MEKFQLIINNTIMVIQRIQSLFLLIAGVLMALVCFVVPVAQGEDAEGALLTVHIYDMLPVLVINLLTAVLLLIAIFLYHNLNLQIKVTRISIVLILISAAVEFIALYSQVNDLKIQWIGSAIMLGCAFILAILGLRGIISDKKLLSSYDRLR